MVIESGNSDGLYDVNILAERLHNRTSGGFILDGGVVKPYTMLDR